MPSGNNGSERQTKLITMNVELRKMILNVVTGGFECQAGKG